MSVQIMLSFVREVERAVAYRYMLLIEPDEAVRESVGSEKGTFLQMFPEVPSVVTSPHITLLHFRAWLVSSAREKLETHVCKFLYALFHQQRSFPVRLENYYGFGNGTVYISIENLDAFLALQTDLQEINQVLELNGCGRAKIINPLHMTLVRGLDMEIYNHILSIYSQRPFHADFPLKKATLVRRAIEGGSWQHVRSFYLPNQQRYFN